jgi:Fur family ferric uptake transcriptional regulator
MAYATQQKQTILEILESSERPLTPVEICETAQRELPRLGIATVYRAIKAFMEEGTVRLVDVPGAPPHYEHASRKHHHFFLCRQCKRLFDLVGCVRGVNALAPSGFEVAGHEIVLFGDCATCAGVSGR